MLMYLIPCILVLVVAVALKLRENKTAKDSTVAEDSNKPKNKHKTAADVKSTKTKIAKSKNLTPQVDTPSKPKNTPVAPELQQRLQQLIHGGHYSSAEAHINQALNRDPHQHELYLTLLKVHLQQKDDLAVNQLINHIRGLQLPELLAEAEAKRYEQEQLQSIESDFLNETTPAENSPTHKKNPFDGLQLQHDLKNNHAPVAQLELTKPNLAKAAAENVEIASHENALLNQSIDTEHDQNDEQQPPSTFNHNDTSKLDFKFSFTDDVSTNEPTPSDDQFLSSPDVSHKTPEPSEFQFNVDSSNATSEQNASSSSSSTEQSADLDNSLNFSFEKSQDLASSQAIIHQDRTQDEPATTTDQPLEFDLSHFSFSLAQDDSTETAPERIVPENGTLEITAFENVTPQALTPTESLHLTPSSDQVVPTNQTVSTKTAETIKTTLEFTTPALLTPESDTNLHATETVIADQQHDVLLQQFPELKHLNTQQLDIDLAGLYADYAAHEAASSLTETLAHKHLNPEQKQQLQQLQQRLNSRL